MLSRRHFLPLTGLAMVAATPLFSRAARPQVRPPRRLVVVFVSGGWDLAHALDAKPGSTFVDTPSGTAKRFGDFEILVDATRPNIETYFQRDGNLGTLIRGISTQSFIHEQSSQRVLTGTAGIDRADLAAQVAADLGAQRPIPYLVLGGQARVGAFGHLASRAGTTNQIASLAGADLLNNDPLQLAGAPGFRADALQENLTEAYLLARSQTMRAQLPDSPVLDLHRQSHERANLLRDFASKNNGLGVRGYTPDLAVQVDVALQALRDDLCQSVFLQHSGWDTHTNNDSQGPLHNQLFGELLRLSDGLQSANLLDNTVVAVLSEMGRTPKLNESGGKDHWPVTAAWIFGAGIRGGQVIGGTNEQLAAQPIDFRSGQVDLMHGRPLQTPNLAATLLHACGTTTTGSLSGAEVVDALFV